MMAGHLSIEIEQEEDGRWIAEIEALPGVMAHGPTPDAARRKGDALAVRVLVDRREHGEPVSGIGDRIGGPMAASPGMLEP